jgi:hypothetical protein
MVYFHSLCFPHLVYEAHCRMPLTLSQADNAYTANDPVFLSYHANIDRILTAFLTTHPQSQFTSNFPLRPFIQNGKIVDYTDPRAYYYSTVGDLAKDTRALGYVYAVPVASNSDIAFDLIRNAGPRDRRVQPAGGVGLALGPSFRSINTETGSRSKESKASPYIIFQDVLCTQTSYTIDVYVAGAASTMPDPVANKDFVGRVTRIGMGTSKYGGRCIRKPVTRIIAIEECLWKEVKEKGIQQVVTELASGTVIPQAKWASWKGFQGKVCWLVNT